MKVLCWWFRQFFPCSLFLNISFPSIIKEVIKRHLGIFKRWNRIHMVQPISHLFASLFTLPSQTQKPSISTSKGFVQFCRLQLETLNLDATPPHATWHTYTPPHTHTQIIKLSCTDPSGVARAFPGGRIEGQNEDKNEQSLRKNKKNWSRFEENGTLAHTGLRLATALTDPYSFIVHTHHTPIIPPQ